MTTTTTAAAIVLLIALLPSGRTIPYRPFLVSRPLYDFASQSLGFGLRMTIKSTPQGCALRPRSVASRNDYLRGRNRSIHGELGNATAKTEDRGNFSPTGFMSFVSASLLFRERFSRAFKPCDLGLPRVGNRWVDSGRQRGGLSSQHKCLPWMGD